jgi:hypothetical protein
LQNLSEIWSTTIVDVRAVRTILLKFKTWLWCCSQKVVPISVLGGEHSEVDKGEDKGEEVWLTHRYFAFRCPVLQHWIVSPKILLLRILTIRVHPYASAVRVARSSRIRIPRGGLQQIRDFVLASIDVTGGTRQVHVLPLKDKQLALFLVSPSPSLQKRYWKINSICARNIF